MTTGTRNALRMWGLLLVLVASSAVAVGGGGCGKPKTEPGEEGFKAASSQIANYKDNAAFGNTPEAKELAAKFSTVMKQVTTEGFSGGVKSTASTDGNVLVYCQMTDKGVAFLVHVPELKKYKDDVRDALAKYAWQVAQIVVPESVPTGRPVGVGLRGTLLYGPVMSGTKGGTNPDKSEHSAEKLLFPFFVTP